MSSVNTSLSSNTLKLSSMNSLDSRIDDIRNVSPNMIPNIGDTFSVITIPNNRDIPIDENWSTMYNGLRMFNYQYN